MPVESRASAQIASSMLQNANSAMQSPQLGPAAIAQKRHSESIAAAHEISGQDFHHVRKRHRGRTGTAEVTSTGVLITHKVDCSREAPGHQQHAANTVYLDTPRLVGNDCRASPLRGQQRFHHQSEYLEDHPEVAFTVFRSYDCEQYHTAIEDSFKKLRLPNLKPGETALVRPYFSILQEDGPAAVPNEEGLKILSESLMSSLDELNTGITGISQIDAFRHTLRAPYVSLYHMRSLVQSAAPDTLSTDVRDLFAYLEDTFGPVYSEADWQFGRGLVSKKHFAKLFRTTDVVISREDGHLVAFRVDDCFYDQSGDVCDYVELKCHRLLFDGQFRRANVTLEVRWPRNSKGEIQISSLSAFPLRFDRDGIREKLLDRGRIFWSCRKRRFVSYTAPNRTFEIQVVNPRYMIDMETYHQSHRKDEEYDNDPQHALVQVDLDLDEPSSDDFAIMLPPQIRGFGMHDKRWKDLLVEHIQTIQWNKTAFDRLVLSSEKKSLITAMVKEHVLSDIATDVIEGKGNGLIILLHGAPGTGKTLTAESVAEVAEKPLYRVTCGDIGIDAEGVEKYLESVLYIATMWKAVVLFDESDVFLEERTQADLQRNALVSAFLRVLEYYDGILILTTNRVGTFDEAFKSRIQLAIHYPKLDVEGRLEIWNDFIHNLEQNDTSSNKDDVSTGINSQQLRSKVGILAIEELNGRQIRNVIRTGRQLASHRREALGYEHLRTSINVIKEFENYIVETHGHTDEDFAKAQNLRA
ncbi:ATPase family associated with various cellular activities (AAA) domain-containing protein [Sarocladium implicatum]|nr:ATPase family associated with various cellular activities (AAA) domain-containing protein [Sarocladium implicatum]